MNNINTALSVNVHGNTVPVGLEQHEGLLCDTNWMQNPRAFWERTIEMSVYDPISGMYTVMKQSGTRRFVAGSAGLVRPNWVEGMIPVPELLYDDVERAFHALRE